MHWDVLSTYSWQLLFILVWLGLCVGSFLNVVIYRLPVMLRNDWQTQARDILGLTEPEPAAEKFNLSVPRSRCPACGHQIRWYENIPVLSWLALRGRCSACKTSISWRYPGIELLTMIATLMVAATFGVGPIGVAAIVATWLLIAMIFIDYDTQLLPDQLTYPLLWLGLLTNALWAAIVPLTDAVIGAAAGYLVLWLTFWGFKLATGKEGMGYGDFKLLAALGAWMGWQALPGIILLSAVTGLVYALARIALRRQARSEPIPFGPFLATAGWVALLFRDIVLAIFLL